MRKIYALLLGTIFSVGIASAQCSADTSTNFFNPNPNTLPCIDSSMAYSQVVSIYVWDSLNMETLLPSFVTQPWWIHFDSIVIDSITNFPTGLTGQFNPANGHLYPHTHSCFLISGTTNDTVGMYTLDFWGRAYFYSNGYSTFWPAGDTSVSLQLFQSSSQNPLKATLSVIRPGSACTTGINDFSEDLNTSMTVYPNPNSGKFDLRINAARRVNGEVIVMDITGRKVYTQQLDVFGLYNNSIDLGRCAKGIYTVQLHTADGFAARKISVE
jgi:hypothetical protein